MIDEARLADAIDKLATKLGELVERIAKLETRLESHADHGASISVLEKDMVALKVRLGLFSIVASIVVPELLKKLGL